MRFPKWTLVSAALGLGMCAVTAAQVSKHRSKVVIDEVSLQGAIHLPEKAKEQLVASLKHREYEGNSECIQDVESRVIVAEKDGWPDAEDQGYLGFSVTAQSEPLHEEPGLLHILVNINVDEGRPKSLKAVTFSYIGASIINPEVLRPLIRLKNGEIYDAHKFRAGLDAIYRAYKERGFIELTSNIETRTDQDDQTVAIGIELNPGQQYRWGHIQVAGLDQSTERLLRSQFLKGSPANPTIVEAFYNKNKRLLPAGASPRNVEWHRNSDRSEVDLTFDFRPSDSQ